MLSAQAQEHNNITILWLSNLSRLERPSTSAGIASATNIKATSPISKSTTRTACTTGTTNVRFATHTVSYRFLNTTLIRGARTSNKANTRITTNAKQHFWYSTLPILQSMAGTINATHFPALLSILTTEVSDTNATMSESYKLYNYLYLSIVAAASRHRKL